MRLRLIAPVLLVIAVTAGGYALIQAESHRDARLVLAGGLAFAAVTGVLVATTDRRRRATRETERFFALSPEMVICAGFDGFWKRVNPAVEVVLGYPEAEALTLPFMELIHPDDRERSEEEAARVMAGATALAFENRMLCKDGTYKWIEWTATPVPEERLMYTIGRDVTERRRSESEEIALRRLATLVAEGLPPAEIFSAVSEEVGRLFGSDLTVVARFDPDGPATVVMGVAKDVPGMPIGSRWELEDGLAAARVYRTGRSARIDAVDRSALSTPIGEVGRRLGVVSTVSCPIHVEGRLWGTITVPAEEPLPPDTEERLEKFTQVVATAIANADSRQAVARLADEQAALRRVATLVARDAPSNEVFESVATEVGRLFDTDITIVGRYDDDGMATAIGNWSASPGGVPVGTRSAVSGRNLLTMVAETGKPARLDGYDDASGEAGEIARRHGWRSSIAAPIVVEGRLWGVMLVASQRPDPFPLGAEERLAAFTDLVATAVANAEAHDEVLRFGDQQAALRRVATLVARGIGPERVFQAVAAEVKVLFGSQLGAIVRFEADGTVTVLSDVGGPHEAGKRVVLDSGYVVHVVRETSRSARFDTDDPSGADMPSLVRSLGIRSAVASPIVVQGELWGAVTAVSLDGPLAPGAERRLTDFTELVATAIANAESRVAIGRLADEQAALRRVAVLVAQQPSPSEVFTAVTEAVGLLLDADLAVLHVFAGDGTATTIASWSGDGPTLPIGTRFPLDGNGGGLATRIFESGAPARMYSHEEAWERSETDVARSLRVRSAVGAPILVEGKLWGALMAATRGVEQWAENAETRLAAFTELVATAIANAEARAEVERLADEQVALRRVATLVAKGTSPPDLVEAVAEEVGRLLPVGSATMGRFEPDGSVTTVASWSTAKAAFPTGERWPTEGTNVAWMVLQTGRSARLDDFSAATDPIGVAAREAGIKSAVGSAIVVEGHLWGVMTATSTEGPLPPDTEARLASFTELVATAIANAKSQGALEQLADEQATLRRIATLVAKGVQPEEVFAAVTEEIGRRFGTDLTTVGRFEDEPPAFVAVALGNGMQGVDVGTRWVLDDPLAAANVFRSGRSVRVDERLRERSAALADMLARLGVVSTVSGPIMVEGRLWGAVTVSSFEELPADTEERLDKFTELVATAVANAESRSEVAASRRRIVAASDETRRQIERNLHDGTQQRLVSLGLAVRAAEANVPLERDDLRAELSGVAKGLVAAVEDLQEISRGIHPAILSKGGLGSALHAMAHRSAIPVNLDVTTEVRLAEPIEVAAYFVASEALANAAKHSEASRIDLSLARRDGSLVLSVRDDGVGGADAGRGSGLVGLTDRVEALGGSIRVSSRPGEGTQITAELPLELDLPQAAD